MDCSLAGSSVYRILQARILERVCPPPGDLPIQGSNPRQLSLLYWQVGFPVGLSGKEPPAMQETWVQSLGWGLYNLGLDYIVCGVAKIWI